MDREQLKVIVGEIKLTYPRFVFVETKEVFDIWHECLKDFDFELTRKAVRKHIMESDFPPSISEVRRRYEVAKREKSDTLRRISRAFQDMQNYYPDGNKDSAAKGIFFCFVANYDNVDGRVALAEHIKDEVIAYVKACECGESELMGFSEKLREILIL